MNLIVGATGLLGNRICALLTDRGKPVRALVRDTSNTDKVAQLEQAGTQVVRGDLKDPRSLESACRGAHTVISTASSTLSRQQGDSIESVDRQGQLNLVDAAEATGVKHFVLISFPQASIEFPLQSAKRVVEDRLRRSRMTHTILQPTFFMEVWLGPALGFDAANGKAQIYGNGHNKVSWISVEDVAQFAAGSVDNDRVKDVTVKLGGPEALSPLEVVHSVEALTGKPVAVQHVPEQALRAQFDGATDSLQRSFAGLMLYYASGDVIDKTEALRLIPVERLKSVRDHFVGALAAIDPIQAAQLETPDPR
jgi:NADH dehydrogenase